MYLFIQVIVAAFPLAPWLSNPQVSDQVCETKPEFSTVMLASDMTRKQLVTSITIVPPLHWGCTLPVRSVA